MKQEIFPKHSTGRTAWNTEWLLIVPALPFAPFNPELALQKLLLFIYGSGICPDNDGITDIKWVIRGYRENY